MAILRTESLQGVMDRTLSELSGVDVWVASAGMWYHECARELLGAILESAQCLGMACAAQKR